MVPRPFSASKIAGRAGGRSNRERNLQKLSKYSKVKVVIFTVLSLIYYQYNVNLPNALKVYQKSS